MTYRDILYSGTVDLTASAEFEEAGVETRENTPEELLAAVIEMEARLDGTHAAVPATDAAFEAINKSYAVHRAGLPKPDNGLNEPHNDRFAFALPWVNISHAYCEAHPNFLASE